jgi:hypothetical protein
MSIPTKLRSKWVVAMLGVLILLIGLEAGLRLFGNRPGFIPLEPALAGLRVHHSTRGFSYRPGFSTYLKHIYYEYQIVINRFGLRSSRQKDEGPFDGNTILAVGGAFTEAWGVGEEDTWPRQLEEILTGRGIDTHVLNAGISAYNLNQVHDLTTELLTEMEPKLVLLGLRVEDKWRLTDPITVVGDVDIQESLVKRVQLLQGGYMLIPAQVTDSRLTGLISAAGQYFYTTGFVLQTLRRVKNTLESLWAVSPVASINSSSIEEDHDLQLLMVGLQRFHESLRTRGIPLLVVLVNTQTPLGKFYTHEYRQNELIAELGAKYGFEIVDPLPMLTRVADGKSIHRYPNRFHWPPFTHSLVAEMVADRIEDLEILHPPPLTR